MRESLGSQSVALPAENSILFDEEEQARLLTHICDVLGVAAQWTPQLRVRIQSLVRGFAWLGRHFEGAKEWRSRLVNLHKSLIAATPAQSSPQRKMHVLAMLLEKQPAESSTVVAHACLGVSALAFCHLASGGELPDTFIAGLKEFLLSPQRHWVEARAHVSLYLISEQGVETDSNEFKPVVKQFLRSVNDLFLAGVNVPSLYRVTDAASPEIHDRPSRSSETAAKEERKPSVFETAPASNLYEFQITQEEHEPALNAYRVLDDPDSLTEAEFFDCGRILVSQLRAPTSDPRRRQKRLHAACRLISMVARLSLETLARLPLDCLGSMYLDVRTGQLFRNLNVVAPRQDRAHKLSTAVSWIPTQVPPEASEVIENELAAVAGAQSIGDLLVVAGLTPTICHALMNDGRTESRVYDSLRVARSLGTFLLREDVQPSEISRTLGSVGLVPRGRQWYLRFDQEVPRAAINRWCLAYGLIGVRAPDERTLIGSPKAPTQEELARWFEQLQKENHSDRMSVTSRSSFEQIARFSNAYVARAVTQIGWSYGGRIQNLAGMTAASVFADPEMVVVGDRASDRYSMYRVCVKTPIIQETVLRLVQHITAVARAAERHGHTKLAAALRANLVSNSADAYAFPVIYRDRKSKEMMVRACTRGDIKKATGRASGELNVPRHFMINEFVRRRAAEAALDALVGQHQVAAPPFGIGSGVSVLDFVGYVRPILEQIHDALGIEPLVGLGLTDLKRLKLPALQLPKQVHLPNNRFLEQRVAIEDFNPPDIYLAEEDCPIDRLTVVCRAELRRLRVRYFASGLVGRHPRGATLFSLIALDGVLTATDLHQFGARLLQAGPESVKGIHAVEVFSEGRELPDAQKLIGEHTVRARSLAAKCADHTMAACLADLRLLLSELDKTWKDFADEQAAARLQALACHAALIEISPIGRFSLFHKAPFIPMRDIRRVLTGQVQESESLNQEGALPRRQHSRDFQQLKLLKKYKNKDSQLGQYRKRANLLHQDLSALEESHSLDFADSELNALIRAETGEAPPFRRVGFNVLNVYVGIQTSFFKLVRELGRYPIGQEEWAAVLRLFIASDSKTKRKHRWAGIHLGAFLSKRGLVVPPELVSGEQIRGNYAPHLSVMVTHRDIDLAGRQVSSLSERAAYRWAPLSLRVRRDVGLRPAEHRFLKAAHVSSDGAHLHVTTSGHDHLKTEQSRGLAAVSIDLRPDVVEHRKRREDSMLRKRASMFVESTEDGYDAFDEVASAAREAIRRITGRPHFRIYDLRANAISDRILGLEDALKRLSDHEPALGRPKTAADYSRKFARGAVAARQARQSTVFTALRYYYLGGAIEVRSDLDQVIQALPVRPAHVQAIGGPTCGAIYASRSRRRKRGDIPEPVGQYLPGVPSQTAMNPAGASTTVAENSERKVSIAVKRDGNAETVRAALLMLAGASLQSASDDVGASQLKVLRLMRASGRELKAAGIVHLPPRVHVAKSQWAKLVQSVAEWALKHQVVLAALLTGGDSRALVAGSSSFSVTSFRFTSNASDVWNDLRRIGISPIFTFGRSVSASERAYAQDQILVAGLHLSNHLVTGESLGSIRFGLAAAKEKTIRQSNHVLGKTGALVVSAVLLTCIGDRR